VWAIVVLILLAVIGWFVFGGGLHRTSTTKIEINTPGASAPAPTGGTGGTPSGGSGGTPPRP
jgi:amino acid transporter